MRFHSRVSVLNTACRAISSSEGTAACTTKTRSDISRNWINRSVFMPACTCAVMSTGPSVGPYSRYRPSINDQRDETTHQARWKPRIWSTASSVHFYDECPLLRPDRFDAAHRSCGLLSGFRWFTFLLRCNNCCDWETKEMHGDVGCLCTENVVQYGQVLNK